MSGALDNDIEQDIMFGVFPPGARLIEDRLMERYGASRHGVRSAFAALEARGLVVHLPNRGVEVVQFTPDEVDALYDVRIVLEVAAAERTRLPAPAPLLAELRQIADAHARAYEAREFRRVFVENMHFHATQYSCCGNPPLIKLIEEYARRVQVIRVIKYDDAAHMQNIIRQHYAIIDAMAGTSVADYVKAVREHLPASAEAFRRFYAQRYANTVVR